MSWWNSLESVTRVNSIAQAATAILAVVAAMTGVLAWVTSSRLETLKAEAATPRLTRLRDSRDAVTTKIAQLPGTQVRIETALGDLEAVAFAKELQELLREAAWRVERIDQSTHSLEFLDGIVVQYDPASAPAATLARRLQDARIGAVSRRDAMTTGVIIRIGRESQEPGRRRTRG